MAEEAGPEAALEPAALDRVLAASPAERTVEAGWAVAWVALVDERCVGAALVDERCVGAALVDERCVGAALCVAAASRPAQTVA
jgi:hypothetical protein